jgi:hypothetical protein
VLEQALKDDLAFCGGKHIGTIPLSDLSIAVVSHFQHSAPGCDAEVPPHASWQGDLAAPRHGQHLA